MEKRTLTLWQTVSKRRSNGVRTPFSKRLNIVKRRLVSVRMDAKRRLASVRMVLNAVHSNVVQRSNAVR